MRAFSVCLAFPIKEASECIEVRVYMKFDSIAGLFMFGGVEPTRLD